MSYRHDIHLDKNFDRAAFAAAVIDIRTLIRRSEIEIVGPSGRPDSLPVVEEFRIALNGVNHNCVCGSSEPEVSTAAPASVALMTDGGAMRARVSLLTSGR